uniref:tRNA-specific adenosine deaminase 1 n=1 Tax=Gasterosteus aculeatus aculeatus TaxID=481459 RepID=UPI001A98D7DA|nr:tRNA-specific adenosine deaminase 1 [Gasterosteus aculeatus aculeatus]
MALADEVAALCLQRWKQLPRTGKPEPGREWTLLAAVLQVTRCANAGRIKKEVVSLGTGTKCVGQTAMSPRGDVLNDSHAEVLARRGCIRYLLQELKRAVRGEENSVFAPADQRGKWKLRPGVSFLFFTSHTPCGDAAIVPVIDGRSRPRPPATSTESHRGTDLKRAAEEPNEADRAKRPRPEEEEAAAPEDGGDTGRSVLQSPADEAPPPPRVPDIHRTGAKCVPGGPAVPLTPGAGYHSTGALRVKPGRGAPTRSLSCSDKLARWGVLGFQGAVLSHYLQEALYFGTVVVGGCPYSQEVMQRALVTRGATPPPPRHCSLTLKSLRAGSAWCKVELFHSSLSLVAATDPEALPDSSRGAELRTYWDFKRASRPYQQAWEQLRRQAFPLWPRCERSLLFFC